MLILGQLRFVRVLVNSLLGGLFFSFLLALLVADLNPNRPAGAGFLASLTLNLAVVYGLLLSVVCAAGYVISRFLFGRGKKLSLISPSFLSLSFSFLILFFLAIF